MTVLDASWVEDDEIADESRVGRSKISETRSTFLAIINAFFRRSKTSFSALLLYLVEKARTLSSNNGISSFKFLADLANFGRVVLRLDRWSEEARIAPCERTERDWRDKIVDCDACARA